MYAYVLLATYRACCQDPSNLWEEQAERSTFELSNEALQEVALLQKYERINLNHASVEELANLHLLSKSQINSFMEHRQRYGKLLTIYELKCIAHFDDQTIESLLPFVYITDLGMYHSGLDFIQEALMAESHYFIGRLERTLEAQKGYSKDAGPSSKYKGNPYRYYCSYHLNHKEHISLGLTLEKDPGEALLWDHSRRTYVFDHIVGHIQVHNFGWLKRMILGNFTMATGQGLVFANGMYMAKSAESVLFVKRNHIGLIPFKSLLESAYFQGVGVTLSKKQIELTMYASLKRSDSRMHQDTSLFDEEYISTIYNTGFHRTSKEYNSKNGILQRDIGYNLRWVRQSLAIGNSVSYTDFQNPQTKNLVPVQPQPLLYNANIFKGSANWVSSLDFSYQYRNLNLFGEYARQIKGQGYVLGMQLSLGRHMDIACLFRDYNSFFNSFYANGFAEYFNNNDERGYYVGIKLSPHKKWTFTAYHDLFMNQQLKYRQYTPGHGAEYLISVTYKPQKKVGIFMQLRHEQKDKNIPSSDENSYKTMPASRYLLSINLKYEVEKNLVLQTKLYSSLHKQSQSNKGIVLAQDISYKHQRTSFAARCALFDINNYNSRIYLYERDVLYAFSFPAYDGRGLRYYVVIQYVLFKHLKIGLKWSQTRYYDREVVGTGAEATEGNIINDLKVQVQWLLGK